ncbi:hypothetical protein ACFL1H_07610, partial [Nanoarchaeota archaeon]
KNLDEIKKNIAKDNIKIYVLDEYKSMYVFITPKQVCLALTYLNQTTGLIINNKKIIELYNKLFDDDVQRSKSIEKFISKIERSVK